MATPPSRDVLETYLEKHQIRPMLKECLNALLHELPEDPLPFIVTFFSDKSGGKSPRAGHGVASDTAMLVSRDGGLGIGDVVDDTESEDDWSDTEEEEDELADLAEVDAAAEEEERKKIAAMKKGRRGSVSSESVRNADAGSMKFPVHDKTPDESMKIYGILNESILVKHLDNGPKQIITQAMFKKEVSPGDLIMKQGDDGDNFYIIDDGTADVYVKGIDALTPEDDGAQTHEQYGGRVQVCGPGDSFGELALMYTAPRAATIIARTNMVLWGVDRQTFRTMIMSTTITKRNKQSDWIQKCPLLQSLMQTERETVIDAMEEEDFSDGDVVIKQGDKGDKFFIVSEGEVVVTQVSESETDSKELARLREGSYFGEIALLTNKERLATITAAGKVQCVSIHRKTFTRVMGPLADILKRNMDYYNLYIKG